MDLAIEFIKGTDSKNKFKFFCLNIGFKLRIINIIMTYIITDPCVGTCDTACVEVCPVDCIHGPDDPEGSGEEAKEDGYDATNKQLYINPEECIDTVEHVSLNVLLMLSTMKMKYLMSTNHP